MSAAPLWTVEAMAAAMGAERSGSLPKGVPGLSIDTRTIRPGEAFFAIKGDARDGHDFVEAALKAGAGLAVIAADRRGELPSDAPLLAVPDVLEGLQALAREARARSKAKFIGVTGSVGKTGTKEALRHVLAAQGPTHASVASYNNHWGVPLSLARMPAATQFGVFELGMNHPGEIAYLAAIASPTVALVNNAQREHQEFMGTVEATAHENGAAISALPVDGFAVYPADDACAPIWKDLAGDREIFDFLGFD